MKRKESPYVFRVVYRISGDERRYTSFFRALSIPFGFVSVFPEGVSFRETALYVEEIELLDTRKLEAVVNAI